LWFFRYGNPTLAAEPGLHDQTPRGVGGVAIPLGHTFDILPELREHFTENPLAGRSVQSKPTGRVMINLAPGQAPQTAQPPVVESMRGQFHLDRYG
jgi:hypothetical protein